MALIHRGEFTVPATVQDRTDLTPEQAFDIIVPIDLSLVFTGWHSIFPGVRGANNQTGAWDHVGASRNPDLSDNSTATETLVEYTRPSSFAYELVGFTDVLGRLVEGVRGEWTYSPDGSGTLIRWSYEFKPWKGRRFIVKRLLVPLWTRYMAVGMRQTVIAAERIAREQAAAGSR